MWQLMAVIVSAVTHDVDHPGNTNLYEINSESMLAMLYNDHAVLENHHCATAFQIMRRPANNIMKDLGKPVAQVRSTRNGHNNSSFTLLSSLQLTAIF